MDKKIKSEYLEIISKYADIKNRQRLGNVLSEIYEYGVRNGKRKALEEIKDDLEKKLKRNDLD